MVLVGEICVVCGEEVFTSGKGIPKCNEHTFKEETKAYQSLLKQGLSDSEARGSIWE